MAVRWTQEVGMLSIARRFLDEIAGSDTQAEPRRPQAGLARRAAARRALDRVRRGKGPAPFTGDERVLLHAAALPALVGAQSDPTPGVSTERVEQVVHGMSLVITARFAERVQNRLHAQAERGGSEARDLETAASVDLLALAVRSATCTPRAQTSNEDERELLETILTSARPDADVLDALAGCYIARGDLRAAGNVRTARSLIHGR